MHDLARRRTTYPLFLSGAAVIAAAVIASFSITALSGTKTGVALALAAIGGPLMVYVAIVAPLIFPFGLYIVAIPFDNILNLGAFGTLTKLLAIVSGAAIFLFLARTRKTVPPPTALFAWAALYAWAAATAFWAVDVRSLFTALATSIELLILFGVVSILPSSRDAVRWVSLATIIGAFLAAAYGAYLFHNGVDIYYGSRLRITTDTGAIDPNHFAAALLLPIALCLTNLLHTHKGWQAVLNVASLTMFVVGIMLSSSRGGMLAIAAMVVYFFIRSRGRLRLMLFTSLMLLGAVVLGSQTHLWTRIGMALSTGGAGRTSIWRVGLVALKSHWLFGIGYNNFTYAYDQAFVQTPHQIWASAAWHRAPHNLLVGTGVEIGIIGLVLLLAAWASQFNMLRNITPSEPEYPMRVALEAAVIGTFIAAQFLDVMIFKYVWLTFMLMALVRNAHYVRRTSYA